MARAGVTTRPQAPSGQRASPVAESARSAQLSALATNEIYWDEVVSIEPDGVEEVYDLTVDGLHSFVAEDVIVHNSIEQDADLVMFVYRDEYYNPEDTESAGIAELILAKHRNGATGLEKLAFQKRYAKFADLAAASSRRSGSARPRRASRVCASPASKRPAPPATSSRTRLPARASAARSLSRRKRPRPGAQPGI
jgi:hypothetical protein